MQEESKNTAGSETVEELTQNLREKFHRESYKAQRKNSKQFEDSLIKTQPVLRSKRLTAPS